MLDVNIIIKLSEKLELKGVNHPILESAMIYAFGFDWEQEELFKEFYEYAKEAMYFDSDPYINTWLVA